MDIKEERIILPVQIIEKIKLRVAPPERGVPFRFKALSKALNKFLDTERYFIGEELYKKFEGYKNLSEKNLQCALKRTSHHESGATTALRNLLCFYAYRKNWLQTLKKLKLTEEDVIREDQKIKGNLGQKSIEDSFLSIKSNIEQSLTQIKLLESIILSKNKKPPLNTDIEDLLISIKENKFKEAEEQLKQGEEEKKAYLKNMIEQALLAFYQSKHEQAIEYSEIILKYEPELLLAVYINTASHIFVKDFLYGMEGFKKLIKLANDNKNYIYLVFAHYLESILHFNSSNLICNNPELSKYLNRDNNLTIILPAPYFKDNREPIFDNLPRLKDIKQNLFLPPEFSSPVIEAINEKFIRNHITFYIWFIQIYLTLFRDCMFDLALMGVKKTLEIQPNNFLLLDFRARFINLWAENTKDETKERERYYQGYLGKGLTFDSAYEHAQYHAICKRQYMAFEFLQKAIKLSPSIKDLAREDYCFQQYRNDMLFERLVS